MLSLHSFTQICFAEISFKKAMQPNAGLQLRRAISIQAEGIKIT
jgi:hypothetical protein